MQELATKNDVREVKDSIQVLRVEILRMMVVQSITIIGLTVDLIQLLA